MKINNQEIIENSYLICSHPRSGSHLLASLLASINIGNPDEFWANELYSYDPPPKTQYENCKNILDKGTSNKVWGGWVHWHHLPRLVNILNMLNIDKDKDKYFVEALESIFPKLKYIYLTRRNKIRQAISWAKLNVLRKWEIREKQNKEPLFEIDNSEIYRLFNTISSYESYFETFFYIHDISVCRVYYEEFLSEESQQLAIQRILKFLGIHFTAPLQLSTPLYKMAGEHSEKIYEDFIKSHKNSELLCR